MNITRETIDRAVKCARDWDKAPVAERKHIAPKLEELTDGLSEAQCGQLAKIVKNRM